MATELHDLRRRNRALREQAHDAMYRDETGTRAVCRDCGVRFAAKPWYRVRTVGHNIPLSRVVDGETRDLVKYDQCAGCNADQGTRTPEEWRADKQAPGVEPIQEITDEQKRIRARVRFDKQRRRAAETGSKGYRGAMPDHLRSHAEMYRATLASLKANAEHLPQVIERHNSELAKYERALASLSSQPPVVKHLFGLVSRPNQKLAASLDYYRGRISQVRPLRDAEVVRLKATESSLERIVAAGGLSHCTCVACAGDFDQRESDYRERRAEERRQAWFGRGSGPPSRHRYRR